MRIMAVLLLVFTAGCATTQISGNSVVDARLKSDITRMIQTIENAQAPGCHAVITQARFVKQEGNSYQEEWTVLSCGKEIIYPVTLTQDVNGGTYFGVQTPKSR